MRFCMVTTFYPPYHFGGDATYVRALSEALTKRGHNVTVVHCEDAYNLVSSSSPSDFGGVETLVKVHKLKSRYGRLSPLITQQTGRPGLKGKELTRILSDDFDVVNFHNISLIGGPGVIKLSHAPLNIYTLHEHWLLCPTHIFWKNGKQPCDVKQCITCCLKSGIPPQYWRYTELINKNIAKLDSFIAPSRFTAEQHVQNGVTKPIHLLPLFSYLSPERYSDQSEGKLRFIVVGRVTASKGIEPLVRFFAKHPEYELQVVGDGDLLEELKICQEGVDSIKFLGAVPQHQLVALYRQATALILPSLAPETFGLTVVEAFSCGVPAIVRVAGGNREVIDKHGCGFLYHSEDELQEIIAKFAQDSGLRARLGVAARKIYETYYTEQHHVDSYLDLVERLMSQKRK